MVFSIQNGSYSSPLVDYPILSEKYGAKESDETNPWFEHAFIEISSLEQLVELTKDVDKKIILWNEVIDGHPLLMIYDNWLE